MTILIGGAVVLAAVIALLLWMSHRAYRPGGAGHDVNQEGRRTKLDAQEKSTRWGAGT
jgi:hypothetical protein